MSFFPSLNNRTTRNGFKAKPLGQQAHALRQLADATLGSGSLKDAVKLPEDEDVNEWIAVHVVDFYNQLNMLYGAITEFCSPESCPRMTAGDEYEYLWQDANSTKFKKPTKLSAPEYIENLMNWCQAYFDNEQYFPVKTGQPFSRSSPSIFKQLLRRLFRVYAHIYCQHFDLITELGLQPHLNTSLQHFVLFSNEFSLVDPKDMLPLKELIDILLKDK